MGIGQTEILIIFVVVLLIFGPKRIPEVANFIGKTMRQFRKASQEIQDSINKELIRQEREERLKQIQAQDAQANIPSTTERVSSSPEESGSSTTSVNEEDSEETAPQISKDPYDFSAGDEAPVSSDGDGTDADTESNKPMTD